MKDVISQKKAAEAVDTDFVDDPNVDVGIRPNESVKQFEARRRAEKKALRNARRSHPLQQDDAKAAIEYATRMADREWILPLKTEKVLSTVQRLAKEILLLSSMISTPSELDAVIDLADAGVSKSIVDLHDPEMWGPGWDSVVEDLNKIERRISMKRILTDQASNIINAQDISLDLRQKTISVVKALETRVERMIEMMGTYGDLRELIQAVKTRASSNENRPGEGSGTPLNYSHIWAWHAAYFLKTGQYNPWMSESESFEPWDNPSIVRLFSAIHFTPFGCEVRMSELIELVDAKRLANFLRQTKADIRLGNSRLSMDSSDITD